MSSEGSIDSILIFRHEVIYFHMRNPIAPTANGGDFVEKVLTSPSLSFSIHIIRTFTAHLMVSYCSSVAWRRRKGI